MQHLHALWIMSKNANDIFNTPNTSIEDSDQNTLPISYESLIVGTKLPVQKNIDGNVGYHVAEILAIKGNSFQEHSINNSDSIMLFYVHYTEFNKRLDEWVDPSRLDLTKIQWPPKPSTKRKTAAPIASKSKATKSKSTTLKTPTKKSTASKRQSSRTVQLESITPTKNEQETIIARESIEIELSTLSSSNILEETGSVSDMEASTSSLVSTVGGIETIATLSDTDPVQSYRAAMEKLRTGGSMTMRTEELSRVKNVTMIEMGKYRVNAWYFSPYPESVTSGSVLYICETCLEPFPDLTALQRHRLKCTVTVPPGSEIYRKDGLSFFEIDGHKQKAWCRNLCLLSKLFLDHKTLYYDVDPFMFYILTSIDEHGAHLVGYFSKEKQSIDNYNVACILTLPQHQRKGYGKFLITLSYELSKIQKITGSPEKPLSDLGLLSYRSYWTEVIVKILLDRAGKQEISIQEISIMTSITADDILHTLQALDIIKYYKGQHIVLLTNKVIEDYEKIIRKPSIKFDSKELCWIPLVFTANQLKYI